jgi:tRNA dimethylallyltransferase
LDASSKPAVLAVAGPTATGKTALGVFLAEALSGEIISADSMQIYRGLDIGTAKVTPQETHGIPHYGIDILPPEAAFSVADFCMMAAGFAADIEKRCKVPILVGGTGLYLESFLNGVRFAPDKTDPALRASLAAELKERGAEEMYRELEKADPEAARATHPNNTVRVLRALEHYRATGKTLTEQKAASLPPEKPYRALIFGLDYPERAALYEKIDRRVDRMLEAGVLGEAELVYQNRERYRTAAQAIGYKEFFPYFAGESDLAACTDKLKQASRNYAKRQLTWFRRMEGVCWLDAGASDIQKQALDAARQFLKGAQQT